MIYLKITDGEIESTSRKIPLGMTVSDAFFDTHLPFCFHMVDGELVLKDNAEELMSGYQLLLEKEEQERVAAKAEEAKQLVIAEINATFEEEIAAIKAGYTEDEIKSWPQQIAEAEAYQADNTAATPLLDAMIAATGGTKDELVLSIATNATQYAQVFGAALGKKQKAIADLG